MPDPPCHARRHSVSDDPRKMKAHPACASRGAAGTPNDRHPRAPAGRGQGPGEFYPPPTGYPPKWLKCAENGRKRRKRGRSAPKTSATTTNRNWRGAGRDEAHGDEAHDKEDDEEEEDDAEEEDDEAGRRRGRRGRKKERSAAEVDSLNEPTVSNGGHDAHEEQSRKLQRTVHYHGYYRNVSCSSAPVARWPPWRRPTE